MSTSGDFHLFAIFIVLYIALSFWLDFIALSCLVKKIAWV